MQRKRGRLSNQNEQSTTTNIHPSQPIDYQSDKSKRLESIGYLHKAEAISRLCKIVGCKGKTNKIYVKYHAKIM